MGLEGIVSIRQDGIVDSQGDIALMDLIIDLVVEGAGTAGGALGFAEEATCHRNKLGLIEDQFHR